jgi:hypothetical protein
MDPAQDHGLMDVETHDVVIRGLRFRQGPHDETPRPRCLRPGDLRSGASVRVRPDITRTGRPSRRGAGCPAACTTDPGGVLLPGVWTVRMRQTQRIAPSARTPRALGVVTLVSLWPGCGMSRGEAQPPNVRPRPPPIPEDSSPATGHRKGRHPGTRCCGCSRRRPSDPR